MSGNVANEELTIRLIHLVRQRWNHKRLPVLLSQLGIQGGTELSVAKKRLGMTVKQYVSTQLSSDLQVIQDPNRTQLIGALPKSVDVESEGGVENLLKRTQQSSTSTVPRYSAALWAAFRMPLEDNKFRYITDQEPIKFRDSTRTDESFGQEVGREYILGTDAEPHQVAKRIHDWFEDNEIDPNVYERNSRSHETQSLEPRNLLDCLLASLDSGELKRVIIPLDVIRKLRRKQM